MGKNKNKGFDIAKRQEKILKKMAQPLYKKPPESAYLVITKPFGMNESPAAREAPDTNRLSAWISCVFQQPSILEAVYTMSTRDEVIIKITEGFDVTLMLGKHRYSNILNQGWADPDAASCVFEYDYPNNGDPSVHNWREHIALDASAPPGHFRNPYPAPTWTCRPSELASLARSLPDSVPRTPPPSPGPSSSNAQQGDAAREFRKRDETAAVKSPFSASGSVKLEPSSNAASAIKSEEPAYEPTQALMDEMARLNGSGLQANNNVRVKEEQSEYEHGDAQAVRVKQEPRDVQSESLGSAIGPSQALLDEWSRLQSQQQQHAGPATPIKPEPANLQSMAPFLTNPQPPRASGSREHTSTERRPSFEKIKREPTEDGDEVDLQPWKRPRREFN